VVVVNFESEKIKPAEHTSLAEGRSLLEKITQWQLRELLSYWIDIHPEDGLPARSLIDPMRMPKVLPNITMMDVERDPFRLKFRLLGTAVTHAFGRDFTGKYFDEVFEEYEKSLGYQQRKYVTDTGLPIHFSGNGKLKYNLDYASVEWVLLPLASDGKNVDIIISAISYGGE